MVDAEKPPLTLAPLLARFAGESAKIRRLVALDEEFCDIVEDFLLAHETLQNFRNQPVVDHAKVADYVTLIGQLEKDVREHLSRSTWASP